MGKEKKYASRIEMTAKRCIGNQEGVSNKVRFSQFLIAPRCSGFVDDIDRQLRVAGLAGGAALLFFWLQLDEVVFKRLLTKEKRPKQRIFEHQSTNDCEILYRICLYQFNVRSATSFGLHAEGLN